jgi:Heparinase II/III-like protein/Heparinase II/III N-terminus
VNDLVITERGIRLVQTLAASAVALAVLLVANGLSTAGAPDNRWMSLRGLAALDAAPCPSTTSIALPTVSPARIEAARERRFSVFGPKPTGLGEPIDWHTDPLGAERYRQNLHKLRFLTPLLSSYAYDDQTADLEQAVAIGLDWVRHNPRGAPATADEAWSSKVVGDRIPFLAYMVRAGACEGLLSPAHGRLLLASLTEHGKALASNAIYPADNHGLFVDLGLARLSSFLPFLDRDEDWRALARARFERTLRRRLSEGVWLEHSSAYQFLAIRSLESLIDVLGSDPELDGLLAQMHEAAAWFVKPDGELTQFGDSNLEPVPEWARAQAGDLSGSRTYFRAGWAFVRVSGDGGDVGYLAVTDGFHNLTHKHADELSFELFDRGASIVSDTGLYHKDPGEIRDYVVSNRAHSGLSVDGLDLLIADPGLTYGSGLTAAGGGDGWYAIEGKNPLLRAQGVAHRRLFLYKPGVALVIVDSLDSSLAHAYIRYLQLHPDVTLGDRDKHSIQINAPGFAGLIYDARGETPAWRTQARAQRDPLQGWSSPEFREFVPRWTLAFAHTGASETRALTIALDASALRATGAASGGPTTTVDLTDAAGTASALEVTHDRRKLTVVASP